jgi:three-Cys-motif partner protein
MTHRFGGTWTELKLDVIEGYLGFYTLVLKDKPSANSPFKLWYVDAFAGSGSRTVEITRGGMFEGTPTRVEELELAGSAKRALSVQPSFHRFVFIEGDGGRFQGLEQLKAEFPTKAIECREGEANAEISRLFNSPPWSDQRNGRGAHRAVVFLDPYGMSVKWPTLELLAATRSVDVWYLFPLEAVNRQLTGELSRVEEYKQLKLDEIFGTTNWRQELYAQTRQVGLFDETPTEATKIVGKAEIEQYVLNRLGSIFSYVSAPIRLSGTGRGQIFSLICLSNSESPAAVGLIKRGVKWLHDQYAYASASRRTYDH